MAGAKPAAKPVAAAGAKAAAKAPAKPAAAAAALAARKLVAPAKATRAKSAAGTQAGGAAARVAAVRSQLVRDSFTMPEQEYAVLGAVRQACLQAGFEVKKSELLRIGVALLGQLDTAALRAILASLPQLKTGRPPGE
ncbi:hypothetical protein HH212_25425 [Massilia forsythiae]|uniref:Uncharacterized protein n=1 Tax=Massilia forsythiae TaxID=2728020 RepID=A0A7Z2W2K0_9BURK|nr:hypothetical protein HH212_25425 [Massilia forsythiae]